MDGSGTADRVDRAAHAREPVDILGISKRLQKDPRWLTVIEPLRTRMMREARQNGISKVEAQAWTYSELDRLYPPLPKPAPEPRKVQSNALSDSPKPSGNDLQSNDTRRGGNLSESGRVSGLADIPAAWPDLPANASLCTEIGWVQAERLRIVEERPSGGTAVRLELARTPAPSWAALSWLETSIRSYAKFVEVAAKATATQADEQEFVRRERMAIEEIRGLLAEMLSAGKG